MIGDPFGSHGFCREELYLQVYGVCYILTSQNCPVQMGDKFEVREGRSPVLFVLVFGSEVIHLLVCPASLTYVNYPMSDKKKSSKLMQMAKGEVSLFSVCVSHV